MQKNNDFAELVAWLSDEYRLQSDRYGGQPQGMNELNELNEPPAGLTEKALVFGLV